MVASSNQQETVMDAQKFELHALSDDQLDAVSGGTKADLAAQAKQNALEQAQKDLEDKKQADGLKGFQQALQELP
jgi:hypothetical protein